MFKRFQVLDLFHGNKSFDVKEWVDVEKELPEGKQGIFKVKLSNGTEVLAYFCQDKLVPMMKYIKGDLSYWWDKSTQQPLYNVTHWGR
jgi:hypothetical protein